MPRRRKPLHLRLIDGDFQPSRHNAREPATTGPASPRAPRHLSAAAKRAWREILTIAPEATIRNADQLMVEVTANTMADYREILKVARAGSLIENSPNGSRVHVLRTEARKLTSTLHRLLSELGFTPASRTRIIADDSDPDLYRELNAFRDRKQP